MRRFLALAPAVEEVAKYCNFSAVLTDSPGFSVPRTDSKMGVIAVPTTNIVLRWCRLSASCRQYCYLGDGH